MEIFEHLSMVAFLILGLAMVKLMTSFGAIISYGIARQPKEGSHTITTYWLHTLLSIMVLTSMVMFWWNAYPLNDLTRMPAESWNLFKYLLFLCTPVAYFLMSDLLLPDDPTGKKLDLKLYYYDHARPIMSLAVLLQLFSLINLVLFFGDDFTSTRCMGRIVLIVLLSPLIYSRNERLHLTVMSLFFLGFIGSIMKYHVFVS